MRLPRQHIRLHAECPQPWPMRELRILVERDVLLPVLYGDLPHRELQRQLRESPIADADREAWKRFTESVEGTTYVRSMEEYTGACPLAAC